MTSNPEPLDVICLSLESWDDVWRRNQHLADHLLGLRPSLRLLFVGPPIDVAWSLRQRRRPVSSPLRPVGPTGRLWTMNPRKWLPRRIWQHGDRSLFDQVVRAGTWLGLERPLLWVNDSTYASLAVETGRPIIYDITDDWLLTSGPRREMDRQRHNDSLLLSQSTEVVVCSTTLAESRGRRRSVHVITNGVDVEHLRAPTERPGDLPRGRIILYQGTLVDGRLDIELCLGLCSAMSGIASVVFVGPNSLSRNAEQALADAGAVILNSRPYSGMPAYLQHADVLIVPHRVTPFTESLDPIKAREFAAVGRPVVSTPVAGFRELAPPFMLAGAESFVEEVGAILSRPPPPPGPGPVVGDPATWADQASKFLQVLESAAARRRDGDSPTAATPTVGEGEGSASQPG